MSSNEMLLHLRINLVAVEGKYRISVVPIAQDVNLRRKLQYKPAYADIVVNEDMR